MYSTPLSSNSSMFSIGGFRGSKTPSPPAIIITGASCFVPFEVVTSKLPSSFLSIFTAASPNVKPGLKGSICFIKLSTNSPARIEGNPGIS